MKKFLSLLFTVMLIGSMPVCMAEENTNVSISISDYANYDTIFKLDEVVGRNTNFPDVIFNSGNFNSDVTLGDMAYSFIGLSGENNDSIKLSANTTITLDDGIYKKIGFIGYGLNSDCNLIGTIKYKDGSKENFPNSFVVKSATGTATLSTAAGKGLKKGGTNIRPKAVTGENELFINAYEIVPEKASAISSIEFNASDCVIMAVSALKYTQAELDNISSGAINTYWESYKDKKVNEIADTDVENLNTLYNGLVTAKANGTNPEIATDDNIEKIANLKDGYQLYKTKKGYSEYFASAYTTKDYRTLSATDISDSDISVIEEIIAKYTEAESFNETKYEEIMKYFVLTDEFNTYNLSDKTTLVNLKTTYERNKDEKELNDKINSIYNVYKDKTASDLTDSDITELDKLIGYYEEAKTKEYSYSEENYAKIKKLRNNYVNFKNSESDICYDLSSYFTGSVIANNNDTSETFGFRDSHGYVGWSVAGFSNYIKNGYIPAKNNFNYTYDGYLGTNPQIEKETLSKEVNFKAPTDLTATGKNAVIFYGGNDTNGAGVKSVKINAPKRISKRIAFLFAQGRDDIYMNVTVKYTDGDMLEQTWRTRWAGHENSTTLDQGAKLLRELNSTSISAMTTSGSTNKVMARGLILDVPEGKIVESVTIKPTNSGGFALLGISEIPVSNADFTTKLTAQWDLVKNYETITSAELSETNKMILYVDECEKRGIDPATYDVDVTRVNDFREMNLTATSTVYRADKNTVKAEFDFSVAVTQTDIKNKLTVTKNAKEVTDYIAEFSNNGKKLTLTFDETRNGGNEYNVTLSGGLSIEKFPSITLGADNSFSYTVPDYVENSYDGSKFTVKNNSRKEVKGYVGVSIFETDEKTVVYSNVLPYTVDGESSVDVDCDTTAYNGKVAKIMLWDENMNVITNDSLVSSCTSEVVKTADYNEPTFDMKTESVKLNGITPSKEAGKLVSLKVVEKSGRRSVGDVIFAGVQKTTKDGYFDFGFVLPSQGSKTLEFTIGGDDFATPKTLTKTIYYFAPTDRQAYIESLKGMDEATLTAEIPTMKENLAIAFDPANAISDSDYAKAIIANSNRLIPTDIAKTQENLKKIAIVVAFSGDNAQLLMSGNEFKYDDIMKYSEIDSNGVTLYSILKNEISDKGIAEFKKAVFSKNYANESELFLAIKQAIFLNAINYPKNGGVGYIADLLTAKNAQSAQIDITNYLNNSSYDFNTAIAQKAGSFKNLAEVAAFIANYKVVSTPGYVGGGSTTGGSAGGSGGSVSGGFSSNVTEEPKYTFNDVTNIHWAYENIMSLYNKGIISGKAPKTFEPESTITRGELIKMICTAYNLKAVNSGKFVDTKGKWYEEYAQAGYDNGIITGITENEFGGDLPIIRQDICTILYRLSKGQPTITLTFTDANEISDYAKDAVAFMVEKGIVNGFTDNTFAPNNNCTRAQAAKIIDMFLQMK